MSAPGLSYEEELSLRLKEVELEYSRHKKALKIARDGLAEAREAGFTRANELIAQVNDALVAPKDPDPAWDFVVALWKKLTAKFKG